MHDHQHFPDAATSGAPSALRPRPRFDRLAAAAAVLAAFVAAPAIAGVFPEAAVTVLINDNIDDGYIAYGSTSSYPICATCPFQKWWYGSSTLGASFQNSLSPSGVPTDAVGRWGTRYLLGTGASMGWWGFMVPKVSRPYDLGFNASQWTNIQIEFDASLQQLTHEGFIWAAQDADQDANPDQGYLFRIKGEPGNMGASMHEYPSTEADVTSGTRCTAWELRKLTAENTTQLIGKSFINSNCYNTAKPTETFTVSDPADIYTKYLLRNKPYRMRLSWFCGNLRVQVVRVVHPSFAAQTIYKGCGTACGTGSTNIEDCWCTILEWTPLPLEVPLGAGAAGIWTSVGYVTNPSTYNRYDLLTMGYWDPNCDVVCGDWQGWGAVRTDVVPMKFLYEGSLLDLSAGRKLEPAADRGKIDVKTEAPATVSSYNHSIDANPYCNGWNLLADLPAPAVGSSNLDTILAYLEPMHSAVDYESSSGTFSWVDDFDNVAASPTFNPVPIVADGSTPINSSLLEAYDWYRDQVTTGDWVDDPWEECRKWYVILITDGDEACEFEGGLPNPDAVCEPGGAAAKFASPPDTGVPALPVYTIGFSETISADSPLRCIAEQTGGEFYTAANASQLSAALYNVFYVLEGGKRSFSPFKVAPPPSSVGGNPTRDYLAVYPLFQPLEGKTLWAGNLWAFPLNSAQRSIPTTGDCDVDLTQLVWNASDALQAQLDAHTEANPQRFVYMASDHSGSWLRYDLADVAVDAALRAEFTSLLDVSGGISDTEAQQVVNFVRGVFVDNDYDTAGPPLDPRPDGYPVLGDFFHSQPLVVNPPNNPMYFYSYGFGAAGEVGAHDYADFMTQQAKRRRVVLAGANDGMLHAFDGGVWNRDRVNEDVSSDPYDQIHDLGTGTELFAWVPQAVMSKLHNMTAGGSLVHTEQQYLVDGPVVKGDAFIDGDGDGDREWRTVALTSMRRGGRGILALDITQPDPTNGSPDYVPDNSTFAGCRDGSASGCDGEWPKLLWEFSDTADSNANGSPDLGWTWSRPTIARIAVYNGSNPDAPNDVFVAFFGGGWDASESDLTGTYLYGVDVATGAILLKTNMSVALPGGVTALDSDVDGFHDRIYVADSDGGVHRLQFPSPTSNTATGAAAGTLTRIFDFSSAAADGGFPDRQQFFTRPVPVATSFDGSNYTWALALGSGDRANLGDETTGIDHFFFLVDAGDTTTRGKNELVAVDYSELTGAFDCTTNALTPPKYGWYLSLRDTEKVNFDATVLDGYVYFPTFDPSTAVATHNVPDQCGGSASSGGDGGDGGDPTVVCRASGIGRIYKLWYECGMGEYSEVNDIVTGIEANDIDGVNIVTATDTSPEKGDIETGDPILRTHRVTNWRQE